MVTKKKNKLIVYSKFNSNFFYKMVLFILFSLEGISLLVYYAEKMDLLSLLPYTLHPAVQLIVATNFFQGGVFIVLLAHFFFIVFRMSLNKKTTFYLDKKMVRGSGFKIRNIGAIVVWDIEDFLFEQSMERFNALFTHCEPDTSKVRYSCIGVVDENTYQKLKKTIEELNLDPSFQRKNMIQSPEKQEEYLKILEKKYSENIEYGSFPDNVKVIGARKIDELPVWNAAEQIAQAMNCSIVDLSGMIVDIREPSHFNMSLQQRIEQGLIEVVNPGPPPEEIVEKIQKDKLIIKWKYCQSQFIWPSFLLSLVMMIFGGIGIINTYSLWWLIILVPGLLIFAFLLVVRGHGENKLEITPHNIIYRCSYFAQKPKQMELSLIETIRTSEISIETMTFISDKKKMICFIKPEQALWVQLKIEYYLFQMIIANKNNLGIHI